MTVFFFQEIKLEELPAKEEDILMHLNEARTAKKIACLVLLLLYQSREVSLILNIIFFSGLKNLDFGLKRGR